MSRARAPAVFVPATTPPRARRATPARATATLSSTIASPVALPIVLPIALSMVATTSVPSRAAAPVPEPDGYRTDAYDAPVPAGLVGAATVAGPEVRALLEAGAVVVDVLPEIRRPKDLPEDALWLPPPHRGVAGALWLPDVGYGDLAPITRAYLLDHLEAATGGNRAHPLVFYCRIDCWMSWNAARRALDAGYTHVHWYRDGLDDWEFEGFPVAVLRPAPGPRLPGDPGTDPRSSPGAEGIER